MALRSAGGTDHPAWLTVAGTLVGYGLILAVMAVVLFAVPYLLFN